jgi:two-component system, OmpR family, phosphate regulon response regulator PhoB
MPRGGDAIEAAVVSSPADLFVRNELSADLGVADPNDLHGAGSGNAPVPHARGEAAAPARTVLVAEDDATFRTALHQYLESSGYHVAETEDMLSSLRAVFQQTADLVILDLDRDGSTFEALTKIRRRSTVPVIVCSGHASERDRVRLLDLGADDVVAKPYSLAELEARIRAVLRRGSAAQAATLQVGELMVDPGTRTVTLHDDEVTLTRKEFDLLAFLAASPGRVFSREELLERVWGSTSRWQGRSTVTEHIRRVRLKIETDPERPQWITTVRGIGYRFQAAA